jgi:hypothetical protein
VSAIPRDELVTALTGFRLKVRAADHSALYPVVSGEVDDPAGVADVLLATLSRIAAHAGAGRMNETPAEKIAAFAENLRDRPEAPWHLVLAAWLESLAPDAEAARTENGILRFNWCDDPECIRHALHVADAYLMQREQERLSDAGLSLAGEGEVPA